MRRFGRIFAASTMLVACARMAYEMLWARRAKEVRGMTGLCSVPCSLFLVIAAFSFHGAAAGGVIMLTAGQMARLAEAMKARETVDKQQETAALDLLRQKHNYLILKNGGTK